MDKTVTIYGRDNCSYCMRAILLCQAKGYNYQYLLLGTDVPKEFVEEKIGDTFSTVPQIFIGDEHVGGYDEFCVASK